MACSACGTENPPGARKQVTVLFADIVGYTELIRDRDTEVAQHLLDGVVRLMMDAVHRYREALAPANELGMRPLQAHSHLGLGKLYRRAGRLQEAQAELQKAVTMLREMGMNFWLPEAERELAQAASA